jgi:uncharacterized membrane protein YkoI
MKIVSSPLLLALSLTLALALSPFVPSHAAGSISQQQAVSIAQQVYPGRVLAVKREAAVYRIKTLSDSGEVRIIVVDASSGKVISGP